MNPNVARPFIKNIAFFGDANIPKDDPTYKDAYEVAKILGCHGYTIVNGGGPGVMDAATKGATDGGGETLTVTFNPTDAPGFEGKYLGNIPDKEIVTTNYIDRMFKLLEHADMFLIFKGGSGTISEWGTAWVLAKLYYGHHKPFILYGAHWVPIIDSVIKNMNIDRQELNVFEVCTEVKDILPEVQKFARRLEKLDHSKHTKTSVDKVFIK